MILRELITLIGFQVNDSELRTAEAKIKATANSLISVGAKMSLAITTPIIGLAAAMTKAASDATETQNKFNQVFRGISDDANAWVNDFSKTVGRSKYATQESLAAFQSFFVGLDFGNKDASGMSKTLQQLAVDFGSFNNLSDEEASQRFISAMSGSAEVLDRFGINLKASALDIELQRQGLAKSTQEATEQQKVMARLALITKAMTAQGAVGDAVRTLGDFANRMRQVQARIRDVLVGFGGQLIPWLNRLLGAALPVLDWLINLSDSTKRFTIILAGLLAVAGPIAVFIGTVLRFLPFILRFVPQIALIITIVTALSFIIEDIMTWIKGGPSLIGTWLGSFDGFKAKVMPFIQTIQQWLAINLPTLFRNIVTIIQTVIVPAIIQTAMAIWEIVYPLINGIKEIVFALFEFVSGLFQRFAPVFVEKFIPLVTTILKFIGMIFSGVVNTVGGIIKILSGLLMFIGGVFTGNWKAAWQGIKNIFVGIWEAISNALATVFKTVTGIFGIISKLIGFGAAATGKALGSLPSAITTAGAITLATGTALSGAEAGIDPARFASIGTQAITSAKTIQLQPIVNVDVGSVRSTDDAQNVAAEVELAVERVLSAEARKIQASNPEVE